MSQTLCWIRPQTCTACTAVFTAKYCQSPRHDWQSPCRTCIIQKI